MNKKTIKKINNLVINYLNVAGLSKETDLNNDNPIIIYFMNNIIYNYLNKNPQNKISDFNPVNIKELEKEFSYKDIKLTRVLLPSIITESYYLYNNLDEINNNHRNIELEDDEEMIESPVDEMVFNNFLKNMKEDYKNSLYDLISTYKSRKPNIINIKKNILKDKMKELVENEDYEKANKIKNKIEKL